MTLRQKEVGFMKERENLKSDMDLKQELNELKLSRKLQHNEEKLKVS